MSTPYTAVIFCSLSALALSLSSSSPAADNRSEVARKSSAQRIQWSNRMQSMHRTLAVLTTYVNSDKLFNDPENKQEIEENAKRLADLARELKGPVLNSTNQDRSLSLLVLLFADETRQASRFLNSGQRDYGRELLQSVPGYCVTCHVHNDLDPDIVTLPLEPTAKSSKFIDRGEFGYAQLAPT